MSRKKRMLVILSVLIISFVMVSVSSKKSSSYEPSREFNFGNINFENLETSKFIVNPDAANSTQIQTFFDTTFNQLISEGEFPGATISVVNSTNILHYNGYGYADINENELVNPNSTMFRIGSVSKTITWTAVMQLVEQGLIDLDTDVNDYLEAFKIKKKFNQPITMTHLLSHSAGFEADWQHNGDTTEEKLLTLEEYVIKFQPKRVHAPGEFSTYSNYGCGLAGYIVSQVANKSYNQYVEENIFDPLGMNYSNFHQPFPEPVLNVLATEYAKIENGDFLAVQPEYVINPPAGGLATTSIDMAQFIMAHLNNGTVGSTSILQEDTAYQMKQRLHANDPRITGWAYGFTDYEYRGIRILGHLGAVARSTGGIFLLPDYDLGIFYAHNSEPTYGPHQFLYSFLNTFYPVEPFSTLLPDPNFKEEGKKFTGKYSHGGIWETTPAKMDRIYNNIEISISDEGYLLYLGYKFVQVEELLFRMYNGYWFIAFRENEKGQITHQFESGSIVAVHPKQVGMVSLAVSWLLLISCSSIFLVAIFFYPIRKIIARAKKEPNEIKTSNIVTKLTNSLTFSTSLAYPLLVLLTIVLLLTMGSRNMLTNITLVNLACFLQYFVFASSVILLGLTIYSWIKKSGTLSERILSTVIIVTSGFFLWFIFFWNLIGFFFNYGVWIPYGG